MRLPSGEIAGFAQIGGQGGGWRKRRTSISFVSRALLARATPSRSDGVWLISVSIFFSFLNFFYLLILGSLVVLSKTIKALLDRLQPQPLRRGWWGEGLKNHVERDSRLGRERVRIRF